jgi:hypothetical protein
VVPAFLECPLELGVGGTNREVSFPLCLHGTGAQHAGITLVTGKHLATPAATGERASGRYREGFRQTAPFRSGAEEIEHEPGHEFWVVEDGETASTTRVAST